jgi:hypothetical protein
MRRKCWTHSNHDFMTNTSAFHYLLYHNIFALWSYLFFFLGADIFWGKKVTINIKFCRVHCPKIQRWLIRMKNLTLEQSWHIVYHILNIRPTFNFPFMWEGLIVLMMQYNWRSGHRKSSLVLILASWLSLSGGQEKQPGKTWVGRVENIGAILL